MGLALIAAGLSSCQTSYDAPELQDPVAKMVPNTTLAEIKEMIAADYDGENDVVIPVGTKENGDHYIVHGRVISSDASGNIYQNLVIQDETAALTLSIREGSMWTSYRVGQEVVLDATGLYMGTYSGLYQLGWLDEYNGGPSMTFMSWFMFKNHSEKNGLPNQDFSYISLGDEWPSANPYCIVSTISELNSVSATSVQGRNLMSQLVEIQNVHFVEGGKTTFADYQESNEQRALQDAQGNSIVINDSGYATFYNDTLPEGTGTIRGILGFYQDKWQLTIRGLEDVMFDTEGTQDTPYSVSQVIAMNNNGRTGWTRGYIVGSVKAGISTVTSSDDIIFGAEGETFDNVIIAEKAGETDWTKCVAVSLPAGSKFRQFVNLVENDYLIGKALTVRGTFRPFYGMHGITNNGGGLAEFEVDGVEFGDGTGAGTQSSPFKVEYLINNPDPVDNVWVEGYIVGYVNGSDFATGATFNADVAGMTDYNNANVIISSSPTGATVANSVPVRTLDRTAQGLKANPSNLGKKVKIQGNLGPYLNAFGVATTTNWIFQ